MESMTTRLRDGSTTNDRRLDRIVHFDEKSRGYPIRTIVATKRPRSYSWRCDFHYDQGSEGACPEFGWAHELVARPVPVPDQVGRLITSTHAIYYPAQRADPWPGGSYPGATPQYDGTSVLAAAQRVQALGFIDSYRWAFTLEDTLLALGYAGPVVFGFNWLTGCFDPDADGFIHATGSVEGGHCIMGKAVRLVWLPKTTAADKGSGQWLSFLDQERSYVTLHQSWGTDHGIGGDVKMSVADLDVLRRQDGEVCVPVGRRSTAKIALDPNA